MKFALSLLVLPAVLGKPGKRGLGVRPSLPIDGARLDNM
jgi:hypothetical protein